MKNKVLTPSLLEVLIGSPQRLGLANPAPSVSVLDLTSMPRCEARTLCELQSQRIHVHTSEYFLIPCDRHDCEPMKNTLLFTSHRG